jgi:hypothetical protein
MTSEKTTHEDCRGEVFPTEVVSGYPLENLLPGVRRQSTTEDGPEKTVPGIQEIGQYPNSEVPIEGGWDLRLP